MVIICVICFAVGVGADRIISLHNQPRRSRDMIDLNSTQAAAASIVSAPPYPAAKIRGRGRIVASPVDGNPFVRGHPKKIIAVPVEGNPFSSAPEIRR